MLPRSVLNTRRAKRMDSPTITPGTKAQPQAPAPKVELSVSDLLDILPPEAVSELAEALGREPTAKQLAILARSLHIALPRTTPAKPKAERPLSPKPNTNGGASGKLYKNGEPKPPRAKRTGQQPTVALEITPCEYCGNGSTIVGASCRHCGNAKSLADNTTPLTRSHKRTSWAQQTYGDSAGELVGTQFYPRTIWSNNAGYRLGAIEYANDPTLPVAPTYGKPRPPKQTFLSPCGEHTDTRGLYVPIGVRLTAAVIPLFVFPCHCSEPCAVSSIFEDMLWQDIDELLAKAKVDTSDDAQAARVILTPDARPEQDPGTELDLSVILAPILSAATLEDYAVLVATARSVFGLAALAPIINR